TIRSPSVVSVRFAAFDDDRYRARHPFVLEAASMFSAGCGSRRGQMGSWPDGARLRRPTTLDETEGGRRASWARRGRSFAESTAHQVDGPRCVSPRCWLA